MSEKASKGKKGEGGEKETRPRGGEALAAFVPDGDWHENVKALGDVPALEKGKKIESGIILEKKKLGTELYETLVEKFEKGAWLLSSLVPRGTYSARRCCRCRCLYIVSRHAA